MLFVIERPGGALPLGGARGFHEREKGKNNGKRRTERDERARKSDETERLRDDAGRLGAFRAGRAGHAALHGRPAVPVDLQEESLRLQGHDQSVQSAARASARAAGDPAAEAGQAADGRRRHAQVPVAARRRRVRRVGADGPRQPLHGLHLLSGRLSAALRILRHGAAGLQAQPQRRRDRLAFRGHGVRRRARFSITRTSSKPCACSSSRRCGA